MPLSLTAQTLMRVLPALKRTLRAAVGPLGSGGTINKQRVLRLQAPLAAIIDTLASLRRFDRSARVTEHTITTSTGLSLTFDHVCNPRATESKKKGLLVYFHGGAYVVGSPAMYRGMTKRLCSYSAHADVVALKYSLAPTHVFPRQLEQAGAFVDWLTNEAGCSSEQLVFGGDSAGGNLAFATAVMRLQQGKAAPAAVVGMSPWLDLAQTGESLVENAESDPLIPGELCDAVSALFAAGHDRRDPLVSPMFADEQVLSLFPSTMIQAVPEEVLWSDSETFMTRLKEARRNTRTKPTRGSDLQHDAVQDVLEPWPGLFHVWQMATALPEARHALRRQATWIDTVLDKSTQKMEKNSASALAAALTSAA
eukprot:m.38454 g.38454  ORF g.38454 m.38454 type:complete len:367 (-) comp11185_c0_seq1:70-1170(-)